MRRYDPEKPLFSIHIPKCAGTSFTEVLRGWFGENLYRHYFNEIENKKPKKHKLKRGLFVKRFKRRVCVHGHFNKSSGIGVMDYYPYAEQFITVDRDPLETALSNYFYCKRLGDDMFIGGRRAPLRERFRDVNDFLSKCRSYFLDFMPFDVTMDNFEEMFERYFIHIGVAEDLQTSVDVLAERLGFETVEIPRLNVSERDEEVSEKIKDEFMGRHELEYAIYNYALKNYR